MSSEYPDVLGDLVEARRRFEVSGVHYVMALDSPSIAPGELNDLDYSVDVLTAPEPVDDESQLDPKKYGVIVEAGWKRGLLLPDLEGVDTAAYQIDICRQKGGIHPDEPVQLYRFEVKRYK